MSKPDIRVLSIAPYSFLPLRNGGHQAIAKLHHYIGQQLPDHVVSTENNAEHNFAFTLHKVFPNKPLRYLPRYALGKIAAIAARLQCTHIICEHPYMALTAMALSNQLKIPWFIRSHNIEAERFRQLGKKWWPILRRYECYAMTKAHGIFFITPEDAKWAMEQYELPDFKCHIVPFGTDMQQAPTGHTEAKEKLATAYNISKDVPWLYFLGALDYKPNADAVKYILDEVHPRLAKAGLSTEILIGGKGLDESLQARISQTANILYHGFVDDLDVFLKACDVMLNPVLTGGGIKTKAVEALGYNKTVVSTESGAAGLLKDVCGKKLLLSADYDWDNFTKNIITATKQEEDIPAAFYSAYYHGNIADKVISILGNTTY